MAARDNLGPQFFHGTMHKLSPGDMITPGYESNFAMPESAAYPGNRYVHAATNSVRALQWARDAINAREDLGLPKIGGTPKTYQVVPAGMTTEDTDNPGMEDYRSRSPMRVIRRVVYHSPEMVRNQPLSDDAYDRPLRSYHPAAGWRTLPKNMRSWS